jgi:hypothetical protein
MCTSEAEPGGGNERATSSTSDPCVSRSTLRAQRNRHGCSRTAKDRPPTVVSPNCVRCTPPPLTAWPCAGPRKKWSVGERPLAAAMRLLRPRCPNRQNRLRPESDPRLSMPPASLNDNRCGHWAGDGHGRSLPVTTTLVSRLPGDEVGARREAEATAALAWLTTATAIVTGLCVGTRWRPVAAGVRPVEGAPMAPASAHEGVWVPGDPTEPGGRGDRSGRAGA